LWEPEVGEEWNRTMSSGHEQPAVF
jgi:hypothetical protein